MLTRSHKRTAFWIASCGVLSLVVAIALFLLLSKPPDGNIRRDASEPFEATAVGHPTDVSHVSETEVPMDVAGVKGETEVDPRVVCHDPLGELSEECLRSLDAYFLDQPFVWKDFDWLPVSMTYRRILADPEGDRDRVFAALDRTECRLEEGEIRWDLRESCHAESFANYANFLLFCHEADDDFQVTTNDSLPFSERGSAEVRQSTYEKYEDWDGEYERPSGWAGERLLEKRWLLERACIQHDVPTLTWHYISDKRLETLKTLGKRLEVYSETLDSSAMAAFFANSRVMQKDPSLVAQRSTFCERSRRVWATHGRQACTSRPPRTTNGTSTRQKRCLTGST